MLAEGLHKAAGLVQVYRPACLKNVLIFQKLGGTSAIVVNFMAFAQVFRP